MDVCGRGGEVGAGGRGVEPSPQRTSEEPLLNELCWGTRFSQLVIGVGQHGHIQHLFVEERNTDFEAVGHGGLIRAEAVVEGEVAHLAHTLLVELGSVGRLVEVEVAGQSLVSTLSRHDHLNTHGLDLARKEEHRRSRADGGDVVRLEMVNHVRNGVDALGGWVGGEVR